MIKNEQIEEIEQFIYDYVDSKQTERIYLFGSCVDELAKPFVHNKGIAEALYNAGYRKLPEDSIVLSREEYEILVKTAQGKISNMKATEFVKACISSGVIAEALITKEQAKIKAVKEFAEKCMDGVGYGSDERIIKKYLDEFIKEYEK